MMLVIMVTMDDDKGETNPTKNASMQCSKIKLMCLLSDIGFNDYGIYDLQWHLSSIIVPDLDSKIQKTYEKTPLSPMQ